MSIFYFVYRILLIVAVATTSELIATVIGLDVIVENVVIALLPLMVFVTIGSTLLDPGNPYSTHASNLTKRLALGFGVAHG